MSQTRRKVTRPKSKPAAAKPQQRRKLPVMWIAGGAVVIALLVAIVLSMGGEESGTDVEQFGEPTITGEALPRFVQGGADPAVGTPIPEVTGAAFDGSTVSIRRDGAPKAIVFLAHWCPHCQDEVPAVQDWLDQDGLPEGVELVSVATATLAQPGNYPPSSWLEREGWTSPVIVDDRVGTVADAFGLPAFPYWVFVDADGLVAGRWSGGLPTETLAATVESLTAS